MKIKILNKSVVTENRKTFFGYNGWPSIARDESGVLYAVCSGFRMDHLCPFGKIAMYKSRNGGEKWSVPSVISDSYLDDRDPSVTYLGNGKMMMMEFCHPAENYEKNYRNRIFEDSGVSGIGLLDRFRDLSEEDRRGGAIFKVSDDYGETWSEKINIPAHGPHGAIVLKSGEIFLLGKVMFTGNNEDGEIKAYKIDADKLAYSCIGSVPKPDGFEWNQLHEPHCVELDDGRIFGFIRTHVIENDHYFQVYMTVSDNGGKTWSKPAPMGICGSPAHALKLKDGRIALTYAKRVDPLGIYAKIMNKDGTYPEEELLIDAADDNDIGYPASVELDNGDIVTVFYKREALEQQTSISAVKWKLTDEII